MKPKKENKKGGAMSMVFLGMHLSVWIGLLGLIVYSVNIIVVNHYIKIKALQIQSKRFE